MKNFLPKRMHRKCKRGFTLTEITVVMVVMGVILAGIWSVANSAHEAQKEASAVQEEQDITRGIINYVGGRAIPMPATTADNNITPAMIAAQAIPPSYVNPTTGDVDNPWNSGGADSPITNALGVVTGWSHANKGVEVYAMPTGAGATTNVFRVGFYNTTYLGCVALITGATMCDSTQQGCPIQVITAQAAKTCVPTQAGCTGPTGTGLDWQVLGPSTIATMCQANSYTGGANSVEFDYRM